MRWTQGSLVVERVGGALWLESEGIGLLVDAPPGCSLALGDRAARLRSILLLSGRLDRVGGLVSVFASLQRSAEVPLVLRSPLSDERGVALAEAWQRSWGDYPLTLDAVAPGGRFDIGAAEVGSMALRHPTGGPPPMGVALSWAGARVAILPRCRPDGAARRICRDADLVICELGGGGLSAASAVELAGPAELWVSPMPAEQ